MSAQPQDLQPAARILQCTEKEYYADPCVVPSLSQSIAHTLISESPLHAWSRHPRLGGAVSESTVAKDDGQLIHKLMLLGGGDKALAGLTVIHADNYRTKAAQEQRDQALLEGSQSVLAHQLAEKMATAELLLDKLAAEGIDLKSGQSEIAFEWTEDGERGPVLCRGKMDHVHLDQGLILDVKKIRSAHPDTCANHMTAYGYHIQHRAYTGALGKLKPELRGRIRMLFAFVELKPPYAILIAEPDGMMRELGDMQWTRAVFTWERCLLTNRWPGYASGVVQLSPRPWAMKEETGETNATW